jgi:hypothetical protein
MGIREPDAGDDPLDLAARSRLELGGERMMCPRRHGRDEQHRQDSERTDSHGFPPKAAVKAF